jgi:hypothetical protein
MQHNEKINQSIVNQLAEMNALLKNISKILIVLVIFFIIATLLNILPLFIVWLRV